VVPPPPQPAPAAGEIEAVPLPPPVEIRAVGDEADGDADGHTVTVGRAVVPPDEHDGRTVSSEASTRRVVIGTTAGVVCLLAVAASLLVFGRGGDGGSGTTVLGPTTTQVVGLPPPTPQGVSVRRNAEGESVVVAWQAVAEPGTGFTYQVRQENPAGPAVNTAELSVTIDGVRADQRPCYVVIAISPSGQTSNESELACVP
jgi:hypothetical protein